MLYSIQHEKTNFMTTVNIKKSYFFHIDIFWNCILSSVYMCVCLKDTYWKLSIHYRFTIKELWKLTKGIKWRHCNIVLKLEKIKFINTLKNNVQLGDKINGTKRMKQLQNNQTLKVKRFACHNWQTGRQCYSNRKNQFSPHCCLVKVINK